MYQQKKYIQFLSKSSNQHGVHSPFVYNLITKCFYNKTTYPAYKDLKTYRQNLRSNKEVITITDLGSGSKKTNTKERRISEIAKTSGTPLKRAKLGYRLTQYVQPEHILELGTSLGIATQAMHLGHPQAKITTIEGCPNCSKFTQTALADYKNIQFLTGHFSQHLNKGNQQPWDLVFFDGNHTKEATIAYFETLLPSAHNDTIFIFDDIYWSEGMTQAWEIIKQHPQVSVTIDTFFWGFVFFRKEQGKEHFTIRI
ncbi:MULTISPECIES: O-methyltransferase [Bizionia]|uniref:Class I SAM-dependent methyltransferase n=1 Tax=Bizionia algoritergicola TaxID=291187 RepID=A0A5D0QTT5_9FLAO|nr:MULTISPECIES: class I SAM-dependent methyltransferase [Bizionia]OBX23220.1 methyltransferase [Bizionia sp. APA-3]TYB71594.1 class I SAM-dependent methyltransferase [Bizionia algoritergicola]